MYSCPHCLAEVDDEMDICWNCGPSRSGEKDSSFAAAIQEVSEPSKLPPRADASKNKSQWLGLKILALIIVLILGIGLNSVRYVSYEVELLNDDKYGNHFYNNWPHIQLGFPLAHWDDHPPKWRGQIGCYFTLRGNLRAIFPLRLSANLLIWLSLCFFVARGVNRRAKSQHLFKFNIRHILVATTTIAIILGVALRRHKLHRHQVAWAEQAEQEMGAHVYWHEFGPPLIRHLMGRKLWEWGDVIQAVHNTDIEALRHLQGKQYIEVLSPSTIGLDNLDQLADFPSLAAIDLTMCSFELDESDSLQPLWDRIAKIKTLKAINADARICDDRALESLSRLDELVYLDLTDTDVTDAGIEHLKTLGSLRRLELWGSRVSSTGVASIQAALSDCEVSWGDLYQLPLKDLIDSTPKD